MENRALIFLSYARKDKDRVVDLYQRLFNEGHKPWMDVRDILPGENFRLAIESAIHRADFFIAVLSSNSVDRRGFIQRELKQALDIWKENLESDIYLIPLRLEECESPPGLRDFQRVDLFDNDGWTRLLEALKEGTRRKTE